MPSEGDIGPIVDALLFRALPRTPRLATSDRKLLKEFARTLMESSASGSSFTCLLTNDRELQRLNGAFLGHDYPTDVLSFPSGRRSGDLGELAISVGRAEAQAAEFGHSLLDEIRILMLHGFLHLSGLDHERDDGEMARAEQKWREALGLPGTLLARAPRLLARGPRARRVASQ